MIDVRIETRQKSSWSKQYPIVKSILEKLSNELNETFDLVPDTPLFVLIHELMEINLQEKLAQVRAIPVSKQTIDRRKRGGKVNVTATGGQMEIERDSTETGVRTGWLMRNMETLERISGDDEFGYLISRSASGKNAISSFIVQLNSDMFWESYPNDFSEWLQGKMGGLGLMDLSDDAMINILDGVSRLIIQRIDKILRGK